MQTREIPRGQWVEFLNDFSRDHEDWPVTMRVSGSEMGSQEALTGLAFQGISADLKDGEDSMAIMVHVGRTDHDTHIINQPTSIRWEQDSSVRRQEALQIESKSDGTVLLEFVGQPQPERALSG